MSVVENPIINQIEFEGNSKVSTRRTSKRKSSSSRERSSRAPRCSPTFSASSNSIGATASSPLHVDPQIIQRPQNRVDLIFSINEGPTTGVARINFIGNKVFDDDDAARRRSRPKRATGGKFLTTNDNYDPDRLPFDREQLRRFYVSHGYADFHVVSAVAELTPDRRELLHHLHGGRRRQVQVRQGRDQFEDQGASRPVAAPAGQDRSRRRLRRQSGARRPMDALINAVGTKGYAFAEVTSAHRAVTAIRKPIDLVLQDRAGTARLYRQDQHRRQQSHARQGHPSRIPACRRRRLQPRCWSIARAPAFAPWDSSRT